MDSCFYYDQFGNIYENQAKAIYASVSNPKLDIKYNYHEQFFDSFDWTKEPVESIETLFKYRAQHIRDSYDYVILMLSGGDDSGKIFEVFYENNIHLDEIVTVGAFSQDKNKDGEDDENHNKEIYINTRDRLKAYKSSNTKLTTIDYTEYFKNPNQFTLIEKYGNTWMEEIGCFKSVHNLFWYDLKKFLKLDPNKKTAYIMGSDKIRFGWNYELEYPYCSWTDTQVADYGNRYVDDNLYRENFYIHPHETAVKISIKSSHILYNIFKTQIEKDEKHGMLQFLNQLTYYNKYILNVKKPLLYKSEKSLSLVLSARDMYMVNSKSSDMFKIYREGLHDHLSKGASAKKKYQFNCKEYLLEPKIIC